MEFLIAFASTSSAIKAEQSLVDHQLQVTVVPLPSQIRAGCGICLRVKTDDVPLALSVLEQQNIREISLYSRIKEAGTYSYTAHELPYRRGI